MKKIFIDGGARIAEAVPILATNATEGDYYLFEANPAYYETLHKFSDENKNLNFIVKENAIWVEDKDMDFYIATDQWGDVGSTLMPEKEEKLDREHPVKVKAINFSGFLLENFTEDDYIIVKFDIEGAEFMVIPQLIETGAIKLIKELYIEWHDPFYTKINAEEIRNELNKTGIKVIAWEF